MKILKVLGVIILLIIAVGLITPMFLSKDFGAEASLELDAPKDQIYQQVVHLDNWKNWMPWIKMDPNMKLAYSDDDPSQVGDWYSWESDNSDVGNGKLAITKISGERIENEMFFGGATENPGLGYWNFNEGADGKTKVTWGMNGTAEGYLDKWMSVMMPMFMNGTFEAGLKDLEVAANAHPVVAKKMEIKTPELKEFTQEDLNYYGIRMKINMKDLEGGVLHGESFGKIMAFMGENGIEMGGMPMTVYHEFNEETMDADMEFAIPVKETKGDGDGIVAGVIPGGNFIGMTHYGPYEEAGSTWEAMDEVLAKNDKYTLRGTPYECYMNDPTTVADPSEIETLIAYPIQ